MDEQLFQNSQKSVESIVNSIAGGRNLSGIELKDAVDTLERFECWEPLKELIGKLPFDSASKPYHIRKAKFEALVLENPIEAANTLALLVKKMNLSFLEVKDQVIDQIVVHDDWVAKTAIFQTISPVFSEKKSQILCLEYLCYLHEKKLHDESKITELCEKLLEIEPENLRALRYFKLVFMQNGQWDNTRDVLVKIINAQKLESQKYRDAQELAGVYLYHLGRPEDCLRTLQKYCLNSPLDMSTLKYDSFFALGQFANCLNILEQIMSNVHDEQERAVLVLKKAQLCEVMGDDQKALEYVDEIKGVSPVGVDSYEIMINILIKGQKWPQLCTALQELSQAVGEEHLRDQIGIAIKRIQDGLSQENQ